MKAKRILVIDDEEGIRATVSLLLRGRGHVVSAVGSAMDAEKLTRVRSFDIIICDAGLPDRDGLQIALQIKREQPNTRVIIFSGDTSGDRVVAAAHAAGTTLETLQKGNGPERLFAMIDEVLPEEPGTTISWQNTTRRQRS